MWMWLLNLVLSLAGNATIKRLVMSLFNSLVSSATDLVPEAIALIKEANLNAELSGFDKLAYVANKLQEAHPDMAMAAITNVVTSVYDSFQTEIKSV